MAVSALKDKKPENTEAFLTPPSMSSPERVFYHAKVSEIARAAGVADGTIYLYFQNKDDILISLFEEGMNTVIKNVQTEIDKVTDPLEKIRALCPRSSLHD